MKLTRSAHPAFISVLATVAIADVRRTVAANIGVEVPITPATNGPSCKSIELSQAVVNETA
jgi:hypothetical protein